MRILPFYVRVATVREKSGKIRFYSRSGKKSGSFVSGQGISKSLLEVSEKSGNFILRYFIRRFRIDKAILF